MLTAEVFRYLLFPRLRNIWLQEPILRQISKYLALFLFLTPGSALGDD